MTFQVGCDCDRSYHSSKRTLSGTCPERLVGDQRMGIARVSKGKIRVLVADHEGIFRLGLKMVFAVEDDLRVVAEAEKADEVLARAETFRPDLVFIQEEILGESGSNLILAVAKLVPQCKVVATASTSSEESC